MRRFIKLGTIALIAVAVVTQWQRVKELGRQILSETTTQNQWQRVQGLTRQVLSRGTTEEISVSAEENKALVRREAQEIYSSTGNLDAAGEIYAPDFIGHNPSSPEPIRGPEGVKQFAGMYRSAFPDLTSTIEEQIAEGDKVASRWRARGTQQGEIPGLAAASGKEAEITGMTVSHISAEGKIVEAWYNSDDLGMMQQLGLVPE